MRRSDLAVFLFVTLSVGRILAQQTQAQPEWRPNITEDNKAASLDDTMRFISQTLVADSNASLDDTMRFISQTLVADSNTSPTYLAAEAHACKLDGVFLGEARVTGFVQRKFDSTDHPEVNDLVYTPGRAHLWETAGWRMWSFQLTNFVLDFSRIDPLDIVVQERGSRFAVVLGGTSGATTEQATTAQYLGPVKEEDGSPASALRVAKSLNLTAPCTKVGRLQCHQDSASVSKAILLLPDRETAQRIARAALHGALLCGGTKSVSPF